MGTQQTSASGSSQAGMQSGTQQSGAKMSEAAFEEIDADGDDRISEQEAQDSNDSYVMSAFTGIDENDDGYIEKEEIRGDGN